MQDELTRLVRGFQVSQAIAVAVTLGIPDLLVDGARTSDDLAGATETDGDALYRLLRALASIGILHEAEGRSFRTTELGAQLRGGGFARLVGREYFWTAWGHLLDSVRTGENAFKLVNGVDVWEYRAARPEEGAIFDAAMTALTERVNRAVAEAYDFGRFRVVVDVGGGRGTLLAGILARHQDVEGILFDQQHVVAGAQLPDRCRAVAGSFFESVPEGADAYVLKSIIHDWEDVDAIAILRTVRRAMPLHAVLLLVEQDLGPPNQNPTAKFSDLNMLVMPGGRERTIDEYERLFEAVGLRLTGVTPAGTGVDVIEARLEA